jgi:hypothetical protein
VKTLTEGALVILLSVCGTSAASIQFAGEKSEVVISEVSERTACIELLPFDGQGAPRPSAPSTILASFPIMEKFRARELNG